MLLKTTHGKVLLIWLQLELLSFKLVTTLYLPLKDLPYEVRDNRPPTPNSNGNPPARPGYLDNKFANMMQIVGATFFFVLNQFLLGFHLKYSKRYFLLTLGKCIIFAFGIGFVAYQGVETRHNTFQSILEYTFPQYAVVFLFVLFGVRVMNFI